MRIKFIYFAIFVAGLLLLQSCSINSRIKKADKHYDIGEYYTAGNLYKSIYSKLNYNDKQRRAKTSFRQGECFRLTNQQRAEQSYLNAIRNLYPDSIVYLRYAQTLQRNGKYADAIKNYEIYLINDSASLLAKNGIIASKEIAEWRKNPTRHVVKKADNFNTRRASSFSPIFAGSDAETLLFTTTRSLSKNVVQKNSSITGLPFNKIFQAKLNNVGKWEAPAVLQELNTIDDNGVCAFSSDGKKVYTTRSTFDKVSARGTEIFSSNRAGGTWSEPKKIKIFKDSTISVAHPCLAPDDQTIYFVSDAPGGKGGKDIWKATLENDECKYIENLGPDINTTGDEMFPSMSADGMLYFASDGHIGYGGLDIFKASKNKKEEWVVSNMGTPINTQYDDFGITFAGKQEKGFFSSNRNELKGYDNIWSFELLEPTYILEGKVVDENGDPLPDANVRLVSDNGVNSRVKTKKDGTYRIKLERDMECVLLATSRGYLNRKNVLSTINQEDSKTYTLDFQLSSIYKPVPLNDIFFEFGKWELSSASENGLQALVKLMNDNPNVTIEVSAHTDYIGSNAANLSLSEKRAKSVADYMIKAGIETARITSVGYGEDKPVVVSTNLVQKNPFLKENDVLDEAFVLKLTPEQQEQVNQINRRTEFKVVKTTYKLY